MPAFSRMLFGGAGEAGRPQAVAEVRGDSGGQLQGVGQEFDVAGTDDVVEGGGQQVAGLPCAARTETGRRERSAGQWPCAHLSPCFRSSVSASCSTSVARSKLPASISIWPRFVERRGEPAVASKLAGDGNAVLKQGSRGVQVAKTDGG